MRTAIHTVALVVVITGGAARASTGVCDSAPPTSSDACIAAIQSGGTVVNDIFRDQNGLTGPELPVFGSVFNQWPGCDFTVSAGCTGQSLAPFDCPGNYVCNGDANTIANAHTYMDALDRLWWQPCRITNHTLDANNCPVVSCIGDGVGGSYFPWEGLVFDLGGQSNQVAIFADNDHGPQPCESTEYSVFLTDEPLAREVVNDPVTEGIDPTKWNRAVLSSIFTKGFVEVRTPDPAGHAACGDTAEYSVEEDSFVTVYALPCGVTFRYASIVAGNDGLDFPECGFDSNEAELDAVAGLTESGAAVCPDVDNDLYPDCNCPGAPTVCDCNDADATIHPGALEACDSPDLNCDNVPGGCDGDLTCHDGRCLATCIVGEVTFCPGGATCESTDQGLLCVPSDCTVNGCPDGAVCSAGVCVPDCTGVVCPANQQCRDGTCIDRCAGVVCPGSLVCADGACTAPCTCFGGDLGCAGTPGDVCNVDGSCVSPVCDGVVCPAPGDHCDDTLGTCVGYCDGVVCPFGQECTVDVGCVSVCADVTCEAGFVCDLATAACVPEGGEGEGEGEGDGSEGEGDGGEGEGDGGEGEGDKAGDGSGKGAADGCGCAGADPSSTMMLLASLALLSRSGGRRRRTPE